MIKGRRCVETWPLLCAWPYLLVRPVRARSCHPAPSVFDKRPGATGICRPGTRSIGLCEQNCAAIQSSWTGRRWKRNVKNQRLLRVCLGSGNAFVPHKFACRLVNCTQGILVRYFKPIDNTKSPAI
ncbi:hypothetical protein EDD16DRAFT_1591262, partial [Pisolithus croceorrhizus]